MPLIWAADEDLGAVTPDFKGDPLDVLDQLNLLWWKDGSLSPVLVFADLISRAGVRPSQEPNSDLSNGLYNLLAGPILGSLPLSQPLPMLPELGEN